jgi:hypothetical protein
MSSEVTALYQEGLKLGIWEKYDKAISGKKPEKDK